MSSGCVFRSSNICFLGGVIKWLSYLESWSRGVKELFISLKYLKK
jgi:hypothetical protein